MRAPLALITAGCLCTSLAAGARVEQPMGRSPKLSSRLQAPRVWVERAGLFSVHRPESDLWRFDSSQRDPEGTRIPLVAHSDDTGATVSVQSAEGAASAKALTRLLADRLSLDSAVHVDDLELIAARGGDAYAFTFTNGGESRGRVAVVPAGDHLVLVVASWPLGSPAQVSEDVESMIHSLGPALP